MTHYFTQREREQNFSDRVAKAKAQFPMAKSITAVMCPECHGAGERCAAGCSAHPSNWDDCTACKGEGVVVKVSFIEEDDDYQAPAPTPALMALLRGDVSGADGAEPHAFSQLHCPSHGDYAPETKIPPCKFRVGDAVVKVTGDYRISGIVRSVFTTGIGAVRLVVEHKAEGGGSFLHIYNEGNLEALG